MVNPVDEIRDLVSKDDAVIFEEVRCSDLLMVYRHCSGLLTGCNLIGNLCSTHKNSWCGVTKAALQRLAAGPPDDRSDPEPTELTTCSSCGADWKTPIHAIVSRCPECNSKEVSRHYA